MPRFGNVEVGDDFVAAIAPQPVAPARPTIGAIIGASARSTLGQVRYGVPLAVEKLAGTLDANDAAYYQRGLDAASAAGASAAPASLEDVTGGRVGVGRWVAENFAASVPQSLGILGGGIAGGLVGGAPGALAGATAVGTPMFAGSNVARAVEEQGGLSSAAAERAFLSAPVQAASEGLVDRFLPGAGRVLGGFAATQTGNFVARTAKAIVKAGATEAVTEAGQQLGERYAAGIPVTGADAAGEYVNAAVTAFAVGGVIGAGGGFRRGPALTKPTSEVTGEDIKQYVAGYLPAPAAYADAQGNTGIGAEGLAGIAAARNAPQDVAEQAPAPQLALPAPSAFADAEGRTVIGVDGLPEIVRDRNAPRDPWAPPAELQDMLARLGQPEQGPVFGATPFDPASIGPRGSQSSALAQRAVTGDITLTPNAVEAPVNPGRMFTAEPAAELEALSKRKNVAPDVREEAQREIETRWNEAAGIEPLTTDDFKVRLDEVKAGIRNQFVVKLEATSPADLVDKVYDRVLVDQDQSQGSIKLAQRVGLLDADLNPTPRANEIEARRAEQTRAEIAATAPEPAGGIPVGIAPPATTTSVVPPAAPVAALTPAAAPAPAAAPEAVSLRPEPVATPEFAAEWESLKDEAGIARDRETMKSIAQPSSLADAQVKVFNALGTDSSEVETSQVEALAKKMGLVNADMDITPLGHRVFLRTTEGQAEIADAIAERGLEGTATAAFTSGINAELDETPGGSFTNFEDLASFEQGRAWAQNYLRSAGRMRSNAETGAFMDRIGGQRKPTPEQDTQAALNRLIDNVPTTVRDADVAILRRMVREGATAKEVGDALAAMQGGKVLFTQPEARPTTLSPMPVRGQPIFREIDQAPATPQRAEQRVETEEAVRTYDLRNLIELARTEGAMTDARARKLHDLLDQGKVDQVARLTRDFDPDAAPRAARTLPVPPETVDVPANEATITPAADRVFEQAISGKTFFQALDHMVTNAPSLYHREIMKQVRAMAKAIEKTTPMRFDLRVVKIGDTVPESFNSPGIRAMARREDNTMTVLLKSTEMGGASGTNYQLTAHEMLHAVTMSAIDYGAKKKNAATRTGKAINDLYDLFDSVIDHFNARAEAGTLNAFEQRYFQRTNNTLLDPHELISWGLTNPEMQRYLQSIEYKPRQTVFGRVVELLRNLLGLDGKYDTALTELLRVSEKIMSTRGVELESIYARKGTGRTTVLEMQARDTAAGTATIGASNDFVQRIVPLAQNAADRVPWEDTKVKARRIKLGWQSVNSIVRGYADRMPALNDLVAAMRSKDAIHGRFESLAAQVVQSTEQFRQANPKQYDKLMEMMAASTRMKLDPDRAFNDHTHVGFTINPDGSRTITKGKEQDVANAQRAHAQLVKLRNDLSRGDGQGYKLFKEARTANELQNLADMTMRLHQMVALDPEYSLGVANATVSPMDGFMNQELATVADIRAYWEQALQAQQAAVLQFIGRKMGEVSTGSASQIQGMTQRLDPLQDQLAMIQRNLLAMRASPYFHLGRFGNNFGSAVIRTRQDGSVDQAALRHVAEELEKAGFHDAELAEDITRPRFSMRFETVDQTRQFERLMKKLDTEGWLEPDTIKAGPLTRADIFGVAEGMAPALVHRYLENIRNSPTYVPTADMTDAEKASLQARKDEALQLALASWTAMQPNNSIAKVLTARQTVGGYDPNMMRSFAHRASVGARALSNISTAPAKSRAYDAMRSQVLEATEATNNDDAQLLADIQTEMKKRDAITPIDDNSNGFLDRLRAYGHAYFLGFSPAYGAIQIMQVGTNVIPELAKAHGYQKSFHAMRRATPKALAVLNAVRQEAWAQGAKHAADVTLTENVLKRAGLSKSETDFLRRMIATGSLDIGASAHALGEIARGNTGTKRDVALKYAAGIGMYTETMSRLMTSLAAHDLHGGSTIDSAKYAQGVVSEALFDYQNWNRARQLGKQGFAGPITPLLTQFMTFSAQMTEKLFSEFHAAVSAKREGETDAAAAARRTASRKFLLGHTVAITGLAGSLGLPFASVFATVLERLVDGLDDDDTPFDATASWRNFLADVLGEDVGEVLSRGLPRALGFDISSRVGEADLLPFTQLLTDRRSWKESVSAALGRGAGASPDMLMSLLDGGAAMMNGDVLGGMKAAMPVAFKGPTEFYRMTSEGYVDTKGNKLPITPGASAMMWQLLGFNPAEKAEYSEARNDQRGRRVAITTRANQLRQRITRGITAGEDVTDLITEAQAFDADNPAFAVIPSLLAAVKRQGTSVATARAAGAPVGVAMDDLAGRALTSYANTNYR